MVRTPSDQIKAPSRKVYLGNIDDRVTRRVLYELCCLAGPVMELHTPKANPGTRRFAFVHYGDPEVAAYAVCLFNGTVRLFGLQLIVNFANDGAIATRPSVAANPAASQLNSQPLSGAHLENHTLQKPNQKEWQCYSPTAAAEKNTAFFSPTSIATESAHVGGYVPTKVTPPGQVGSYSNQPPSQQRQPAGFVTPRMSAYHGLSARGENGAHTGRTYSPSQPALPPPPPPLPVQTPPPMPSNTPPPPPPPSHGGGQLEASRQQRPALGSREQVPGGVHTYGQRYDTHHPYSKDDYEMSEQQQMLATQAYGAQMYAQQQMYYWQYAQNYQWYPYR